MNSALTLEASERVLGDPRPRATARRWLPLVLIAWVVIYGALLVMNQGTVATLEFRDPDDQLRLQQVRDLLAGQSWFDVHQYRVDASSGGMPMHWSRLVDIPIVALLLLFRPLFGGAGAEQIMLLAVPALTLLAILAITGWMAARVLPRGASALSLLAMAFAVPVMLQVLPLRIDHHGWQIVAVLIALNGLMARDARRGGWLIGSSLAVLISISIEGLPLAAGIVAITALKWLRDRCDRAWMVHTMQALALVSTALFVATRGFADLTQHCDAISPVHLAIFIWGALATTAAAALGPHPRSLIVALMALIGVGALLILRQLAPQCGGGAFVEIDPLVRTFWYERVAEGRPLWDDSFKNAVTTLGLPLFGLAASLHLAAQSNGWLRRWWIDLSLILAAATLIALFVARAGGTACAIAAVPMGWQLREWIRAARHVRQPSRRALALSAVIVALAPAMPISLFLMAVPSEAGLSLASAVRVSTCKIDEAAAGLRKLPRADILAPLDIGPQLVYGTSHSVVATGHHRAATAMRDVISAFMLSEAVARQIVRQRGIEYIALCPSLVEPMIYAFENPDGLAARLRADRAPAWLEPVPMPGDGSFKVWRVVS